MQDSELELAYSFEPYDGVHEMMHVDRRFNNNEKMVAIDYYVRSAINFLIHLIFNKPKKIEKFI